MTVHVTKLLLAGLMVAASAPAWAQEQYPETAIRAASVYEGTQVESLALERFAEAVEERSGGEVTFRVYTGTSLGGQEEINDLLTTGGLDIAVHGIAPSGRYVGLFLPYVVDGDAHLQAILGSEVGTAWSEELSAQAGLAMLSVTFRGDRHTMTVPAVSSVEDLAGLRIRVPDIPAIIATIESWQAVPVVMNIAEVYTGLATGAVEGLENTLGGMLNYRFNEVAKNVLLTQHGSSPVFWLANQEWWDTLDEATATLLREELAAATEWANAENAKLKEEWVATLEGDGVTVVEADVDALRARAEDMIEAEAVKAWGDEAWARIDELR